MNENELNKIAIEYLKKVLDLKENEPTPKDVTLHLIRLKRLLIEFVQFVTKKES